MRFIKRILIIAALAYIAVCVILFFYQENLLFFPEKLAQDYQFQFENEFLEKNVITSSGDTINTLLFHQEDSKGVIYYLHGNGGSLRSVGNVSQHFLPLGYDICMIDYPGYGKSSGRIQTQEQLFNDVQFVYDDLKKSYSEDNIVVLGYSIGTGIAAHLASNNNPSKLVLHSPYYSMEDMMRRNYPIIPVFILEYTLETNNYLSDCNMPVYLFHGANDEVIPVESSEMLSAAFNFPFFKLENQGHNNMSGNKTALEKLSIILND